MTINAAPMRRQAVAPRPRAVAKPAVEPADAFSTALFTGLNIAVFLMLAASVVGAAILYSQGA